MVPLARERLTAEFGMGSGLSLRNSHQAGETHRAGRRVARPNPSAQWEVRPLPELRIAEDALWEKAKARQAGARDAVKNKAERRCSSSAEFERRPSRPFSSVRAH